MYGDRFLARASGARPRRPGPVRERGARFRVSVPAWMAPGRAVMAGRARSEVDSGRTASPLELRSSSARSPPPRAALPRARASRPRAWSRAATRSSRRRPPTFKEALHVSRIHRRGPLRRFSTTLTWKGTREDPRAVSVHPGRRRELSPLEQPTPVQDPAVPEAARVYQDSRHSVGNVPSTNSGRRSVLAADWRTPAFGQAFASERWSRGERARGEDGVRVMLPR